MRTRLGFVLLFLFICGSLPAQDTIRLKRSDRYDRNCSLMICLKQDCYSDSISLQQFAGELKPELRLNDECTAKKKFDIFVSSFELSVTIDGRSRTITSHSSFFTGPQKKIIQSLKPGDVLTLKNIVIHAPDAFRKMDDLKIQLK